MAGDGEQFSLNQVGFAYREGRPALTDVSLSASRGERIALVGPTGAGKSTVTQEVVVFSGTLLENIAMGVDVPDRERAERALDHLGIRELMLARTGGLDARVDERGLNSPSANDSSSPSRAPLVTTRRSCSSTKPPPASTLTRRRASNAPSSSC